ncbi:MAG: N-acetylmuramoyl-L-alanine amidase, partial [Beijerinckiaceae bacterium]
MQSPVRRSRPRRPAPRTLAAALGVLLVVFSVWLALTAETTARTRLQAAHNGPIATQIALIADAESPAIVVDMSAEVRAVTSVMTDPMRVILEFPGLGFHAPALPQPAAGGSIGSVRFGAFMRGAGRIVVELSRPLRVVEQRFLDLDGGGKRLVIRCEPTTRAAFRALANPVSDDIVTGTIARAQAGKGADLPLVFLDPGHGGIDSGASGPGGELEKTIVLQFALALKDRLERGGKARVMLSRTGDVFVPLRDRVRMARQAKAQLFLSLHADALPADEGEARGATIYT